MFGIDPHRLAHRALPFDDIVPPEVATLFHVYFVAGALQQTYQSSLPMFVTIGLAALAAGGIVLFASRASAEAKAERLATSTAA